MPASSRIPLAHGQITAATTQSSSNWSSPPTCRPSSESSGLARQRHHTRQAQRSSRRSHEDLGVRQHPLRPNPGSTEMLTRWMADLAN